MPRVSGSYVALPNKGLSHTTRPARVARRDDDEPAGHERRERRLERRRDPRSRLPRTDDEQAGAARMREQRRERRALARKRVVDELQCIDARERRFEERRQRASRRSRHLACLPRIL